MDQDKLPSLENSDELCKALRLMAAMSREVHTSSLLRQGLELCSGVFECERGFIIIEDEEGSHKIMERCGRTDEGETFSTTALRMVREKGEPLLITDTIENDILSMQESISSNRIRSVLCSMLSVGTPVLEGKRLYLYLDSRTDRHPLSLQDLECFRLVVQLMGGLAERAALLEKQDATIEELRSRIDQKHLDDLVFGSESFKRCVTLVSQAASADVPVLLFGETGTGKERLARLLHELSPRKEKPFLAVNCGAIPPNLVESQLFGHEKGSFTGAVAMRKGYFEEASGGTLFLDEIGELPMAVQPHLLRALQEGEVMRVGSSKPLHVDVRIVAATNADLEKAVAENRFRKDLYYRLNVFPIVVPPVRKRGEDALLLALFFLKRYCETLGRRSALRFSAAAEKAILSYDWPGNVREIQNKVQRAVLVASGSVVDRADLGLEEKSSGYRTLREAREAVDREMIAYAISRSPNNLTNAAKILDIDRKSLRLLLEKYGIKYQDTSGER